MMFTEMFVTWAHNSMHYFSTLCYRLGIADMFSSMRGSMTSSYGASPGRDTTLRRGASMRRAIANQAGLKRRSVAILLKFQTVSPTATSLLGKAF